MMFDMWHKIAAGEAGPKEIEVAHTSVASETPLEEPERVVIAGDWHGDWASVRLDDAAAAGASTLIVLGDFGLWTGKEDYLDSISTKCALHGITVLWLDGNHENFDELSNYPLLNNLRPIRPHLWHLPRGTRWQWGEETWMAVGGGTSLDKAIRNLGIDWWPQEVLTEEEVNVIIKEGSVNVLLTHDCPAEIEHYFGKVPSFWAAEDLGLAQLHRERMQRLVDNVQPNLLFHGHLHKAYQRKVETSWGEMLVTGLDRNQSRYGHTVVMEVGAAKKMELLTSSSA